MKTFQAVKAEYSKYVPSWYNEEVHTNVVGILKRDGKLHACKFLRDVSNHIKNKPLSNTPTDEFFLGPAKELCDFIVDGTYSLKLTYTIDDLKKLLEEFYLKGRDYEIEQGIAEHTSSIGHSNPYGQKDASEVFEELFKIKFPQ